MMLFACSVTAVHNSVNVAVQLPPDVGNMCLLTVQKHTQFPQTMQWQRSPSILIPLMSLTVQALDLTSSNPLTRSHRSHVCANGPVLYSLHRMPKGPAAQISLVSKGVS